MQCMCSTTVCPGVFHRNSLGIKAVWQGLCLAIGRLRTVTRSKERAKVRVPHQQRPNPVKNLPKCRLKLGFVNLNEPLYRQ